MTNYKPHHVNHGVDSFGLSLQVNESNKLKLKTLIYNFEFSSLVKSLFNTQTYAAYKPPSGSRFVVLGLYANHKATACRMVFSLNSTVDTEGSTIYAIRTNGVDTHTFVPCLFYQTQDVYLNCKPSTVNLENVTLVGYEETV